MEPSDDCQTAAAPERTGIPERTGTSPVRRLARAVAAWFDAGAIAAGTAEPQHDGVEWARVLPFVGMHLACLAVFWVGTSGVALAVALGLYLVRMFAITGFYHRYFSHRSFKTSRTAQFVFALLGASAVQRGPIWWAAHHRHHHAFSDREQDSHSPVQRGFWWAHVGWFLSRRHFLPDLQRVRDLTAFPELRWLDRFDILVPAALAAGLLVLGQWLESHAPGLGTTGGQMLVWGFFVSTVACYHGTYTINSLCHGWGSRRYATRDDSRNNALLAVVTLGEGWHNNHHHYPSAARQGFYWWEIDITYYLLRGLATMGVVWDLTPVPERIRSMRDTGVA